jgi:regulator of sigma E protease
VEVVYESEGVRKTVDIAPSVFGGMHYRVNFVPEDGTNVVGDIEKDSNGYAAGLRSGDRIIEINGQTMTDRYDIDEYMKSFEGGVLDVRVERGGEVFETSFEAVKVEEPAYRDIGVYYTGSATNPWTALKHSVKFSISTVRSVLMSLAWLVSGTVKFSEMMGPVGIVSTMGETIRQDTFRMFIINLANMTAFISLNLGLINLIPFPALDGSRIVIHVIEGIRKKPFPMEKTAWITIAGFVLLIALLVFATFNDVMRLIGLR